MTPHPARGGALRHGAWLDYLQAVARGGDLSDPIVDRTELRLVDVTRGSVAATVRCGPDWRNFGGVAHGGFAATVCDSVAGFAALTMVGSDELVPTVTANLEYLRLVPLDVTLDATADVIKHGRRLTTVDASLSHDGVLLARGTFLFTPIDGARPDATG
jgi:uncharacterized protein (TIGR00369 family)